MLQFITCTSEKYSLPEEVQMVIEGGCRWIQFSPANLVEEEVRATALQIIEMCRENDTFMIIEDNLELTKELGAYGIHLSDNKLKPSEVREALGAEPIIGVTVKSQSDIIALRGVDVDYVTFPLPVAAPVAQLKASLQSLADIVSYIKANDIQLPIVVTGRLSDEDMESLIKMGVNGFALSSQIVEASDPVEYTSEVIALLGRLPK